MARLVQTSIQTLGFLIALSVVAPSFKAGDSFLLQEPFQLGDFICGTGSEGTVHHIQSRATIVSTAGTKSG